MFPRLLKWKGKIKKHIYTEERVHKHEDTCFLVIVFEIVGDLIRKDIFHIYFNHVCVHICTVQPFWLQSGK